MPDYQDLKLGSHEIRLLALKQGGFDGSILATLSVASLDDCPKYEALSYVWGDQNVCLDIIVNGDTLPVATNLCTALRRRGLHDEKVLWVDAICINQDDHVEKAHQVRLSYREQFSWVKPDLTVKVDKGGIMEGQGIDSLVLGTTETKQAFRKSNGSRSWVTLIDSITALRRIADEFEGLQARIAVLEQENAELKAREEARAGTKRRAILNPNKKFITIHEILSKGGSVEDLEEGLQPEDKVVVEDAPEEDIYGVSDEEVAEEGDIPAEIQTMLGHNNRKPAKFTD